MEINLSTDSGKNWEKIDCQESASQTASPGILLLMQERKIKIINGSTFIGFYLTQERAITGILSVFNLRQKGYWEMVSVAWNDDLYLESLL